jgi:hypothetical protein
MIGWSAQQTVFSSEKSTYSASQRLNAFYFHIGLIFKDKNKLLTMTIITGGLRKKGRRPSTYNSYTSTLTNKVEQPFIWTKNNGTGHPAKHHIARSYAQPLFLGLHIGLLEFLKSRWPRFVERFCKALFTNLLIHWTEGCFIHKGYLKCTLVLGNQ